MNITGAQLEELVAKVVANATKAVIESLLPQVLQAQQDVVKKNTVGDTRVETLTYGTIKYYLREGIKKAWSVSGGDERYLSSRHVMYYASMIYENETGNVLNGGSLQSTLSRYNGTLWQRMSDGSYKLL